MAVSHVSFNLLLRHQSRYRVHDHDIHRSGPHHGLRDLQSLVSAVRLGNIKLVDIHTNILCINRIQRMLCVNKPGNASLLLYFCDHMQRNGRLTTGLRSVDLHHTSPRNTA